MSKTSTQRLWFIEMNSNGRAPFLLPDTAALTRRQCVWNYLDHRGTSELVYRTLDLGYGQRKDGLCQREIADGLIAERDALAEVAK